MRFEQWFAARRNAGMVTSAAEAGLAESQAEGLPPGFETHWLPSTASYPPSPDLPAAAGLWIAHALHLHLHLLAQRNAGRLASLASYCGLVALLVGLLKLTCFVISLAVLVTPGDSFQRPRQAWMFRLAVIGSSTLTAISWNATFPFVPGLRWHPGANRDSMLSILLNQPDRIALMFGRSLRSGAQWWWQDACSRFGGGPKPYFFKVGSGFPLLGGLRVALLLLAGVTVLRSVRVAIILLTIALLYALLVLPLALAMVGVRALLPRRAAPAWVKQGLLAL